MMAICNLNIDYDLTKNKFTTSGNVKPECYKEVVSSFLRSQIGAGEDKRIVDKRDIYNIEIEVDLSEDIFKVSDNCGNKSLRDGILSYFLSTI
jgi:hypothetical protein